MLTRSALQASLKIDALRLTLSLSHASVITIMQQISLLPIARALIHQQREQSAGK